MDQEDAKADIAQLLVELGVLRETLEALRQEKQQVTDEIFSSLTSRVKKYLYLAFGGFSILGTVSVVQLYFQVTAITGQYVSGVIAERFAEPNIQDTLTHVAENQASRLISERLDPEVNAAINLVDQRSEQFQEYIEALREDYNSQFSSLAGEVAVIKQRNALDELADQAISSADALAFDQLAAIALSADGPEGERKIAQAAMARVKLAYLTSTRTSGADVFWYPIPEFRPLVKRPISQAPTEALIMIAERNQDWIVRAVATQELATRKEMEVPEALLRLAETDSNLEVRRNAVRSFESVTAFDSPDILSPSRLRAWYNENRERLAGSLGPLQETPLYRLELHIAEEMPNLTDNSFAILKRPPSLRSGSSGKVGINPDAVRRMGEAGENRDRF